MGDNSWTHPPLFFATSGPTKRQKHYLCLLFSQDWVGVQQKVNDLLTSPSNQFRDYSIWNSIEKLMPQLWNFAPQFLKTSNKNRPIRFQTRLFGEVWVSKNRGFVPGSPPGGFIFPEMTPPKKSSNIGQPSKNVIC